MVTMSQCIAIVKFSILLLVIKINSSQISPLTGEYESRIRKVKEDILSKLGLDDIPSSTISKENLPSALLTDPFYKQEARAHENETETVIKKKMIVVGEVGEWFLWMHRYFSTSVLILHSDNTTSQMR